MAREAEFVTTRTAGFTGKNNCGPTCAVNWLLTMEPVAGAWVKDPAGIHNELMERMHVGRLGAQMWLFSSGLSGYLREAGIPVRIKPHLLVREDGLTRMVRDAPVPLCMLANPAYGWHWVLVLDARRDAGGTVLRIADGWKATPVEVRYGDTGPMRNLVERVG